MPVRERGVAIITAMLVIALGTVTMVAITSQQQLALQRERNEAMIQQARSIGISGERFVAAVLYRDVRDKLRNNSDSLDDDWAQTIPPLPIDNATIQGCIVDMQGRFNLNNIVDAQGNVSNVHYDQFKRLLAQLNIEETKAEAVLDWLDSNIDPTIPDGAEDDHYTSLDPGYRTANRPMSSISELLQVKGFNPMVEEEYEDYKLLVPHISALPNTGGATPVNVNTASPEVLSSLSDSVAEDASYLTRWETTAYQDYPECEELFDLEPENKLDTLFSERDLSPFESIDQFNAELSGDPPPEDTYDVRSNWYEVRINVEAEGIVLSQYTLFERGDDGKSRVVRRSRDTL